MSWNTIFIKLLVVCSVYSMEPSVLIQFTTRLVKTQEAVIFACSREGKP